MLVYSASGSARLDYVLRQLDREIFEVASQHTTDPKRFIDHPGPKLQYGGDRLSGISFYVPAVSLLFEKDIRRQSVDCFLAEQLPVFFGGDGDLPFDLFAAVFFLLSRYEEWLPYAADVYGRFPPDASLAFRNNFLRRPLIDEWLQFFKARLAVFFPGLFFRKRNFSFLPTYDIDMAWSFRGKGIWRNAGGFARSFFTAQTRSLRARFAVLAGSAADPFDSFAWLDQLHETVQLHPWYFLLLASRPGRLDRNVSPSHPAMRTLVKNLADRYNTAIHPSFQSGDDISLLADEIKTLARLSGKPVTASRQHYLRLSMPVTYRRLIDAGILQDFSMGYGSFNGFRASYTGDFYWYDLGNETETKLLLTPFCFMDAAAFYGEGKKAPAALEEMRLLRRNIARVDGRMTTLWHNHLLGTAPEFAGWRDAYELFVKETVIGHRSSKP